MPQNSETDLLARLARVEAELEIQRLIVAYGMAADCSHIEAALACFTKSARYIVTAARPGMDDLVLTGHDEIGAMLRGDLHQELVPDSAHTVGPAVLGQDGDGLFATGYSRLYHKGALMRVAVNRWRFAKQDEGWRIDERVSSVVGEDKAQELLRDHFNI